MFFKYKKKYKELVTQSDTDKIRFDRDLRFMSELKDEAEYNHDMCKKAYQEMFHKYKDALAIIGTIRQIRSDKAFTGKQGAEIDKLIN